MALDKKAYSMSSPAMPAGYALAVTPADADLALPNGVYTRGLYVGVAGDVTVKMASEDVETGTDTVTFTGVLAGSILPIRVAQVRATGTTASEIVALY
jgi:hypothetical protein